MRKRLSLFIAISLVITINGAGVKAAPLSDKLKNQQNQLQQNKTLLKNAKEKVENIEQEIEHLDDQIETKMREVDNNKSNIREIKKNIELTEKDIQKAESDTKKKKELYNLRMRAMYINGLGGYLDVIFGAESLSDLFLRIEAVKKIIELDKKIMQEVKLKQDNIRIKKENLKDERYMLITAANEQMEKLEILKQDKFKQDKLIKEAQKQAALYSNKVKNDEMVINQIKQNVYGITKKVSKYTPSRGVRNVSTNDIVAYSMKFLGKPYKWGATGPNSFDCSGFTQYVFANFGIKMPRVSRDQGKSGKYVPKSQLQLGDLVFYANNKGKGRIHHVGIYIGNGMYIHAPRTGDVVKISSAWRSDYATARRYR
ncbi:NlpC/P60 family protein [Clostridium aestuarii]|uniref:NlpC/P60 family protein n=1 Tax=Clostridium aestuarii TaxID=338193 RepID=A0ABT4D2V1_9CLOT|nr:C40 family peptidase [Clostridium aestuarii]MCY6485567.1 NlpC/P60 family protein [Clostridium aestuarii]